MADGVAETGSVGEAGASGRSTTGTAPANGSDRTRQQRNWVRDGFRLILIASSLMVGVEAVRVLFGDNLHPVVAGSVYRSAQLDTPNLERVASNYGIRSVLNLRGSCPGFPWYEEETRTLERLGIRQYDVALSSGMVPGVPEMREMVRILQAAERPMLIHCRRGSDRTGLVAGMCLLLEPGRTLAEARAQLSWRYGHIPLGATSRLQWVMDWYEDWLKESGREHSPDVFRTWVMEHYQPGPYWAQVEPLEVPTRLPLGRPVAARFRVHNLSRFPWRFRQAAGYGFHLRYLLRTRDRKTAFTGGSGYFEHTLYPGQSLDLTLSLPAVHKPGKYELTVDMAEESVTWFFLLGSPPFQTEVTVDRE